MFTFPQISCRSFAMAFLLGSLFLGSCAEQRLHPDEVEYRKDENGTQVLYPLSEDQPFGSEERAYVEEYYPKGGQKHFEVAFLNGLRDGQERRQRKIRKRAARRSSQAIAQDQVLHVPFTGSLPLWH
jgi:hypothetical protein